MVESIAMKDQGNQLDNLLETVKQDNEILAVFLFGSTVRNDNHRESDVDICLLMKSGQYTPLELSQKKFEYVKLFDMDIQIFQQLPLYIRTRVIREGKRLFCTDEDELYRIVFRTIREFGDFEHIYRNYLKAVANGR